MSKKDCKHIIGVLWERDASSRLVTFEDLKAHIQQEIELKRMFSYYYKEGLIPRKVYSIADYTDKRKSTNLCRFNFCPTCGEKIDWKELRKSEERPSEKENFRTEERRHR